LEVTLFAFVSVGDTSTRQRVDSYVQKITVSVREQTWPEWFDSLRHGVDTVKAIVLALSAAAAGLLSWFGISRRKRKRAAKSTSKRKSSAAAPTPPQSTTRAQ